MPDKRRVGWAAGYCGYPLQYLGPYDRGEVKMDLFYVAEEESLFAFPVVERDVGEYASEELPGYAWSRGNPERVRDLSYALHGGVTAEHAKSAVRTGILRARAKALPLIGED